MTWLKKKLWIQDAETFSVEVVHRSHTHTLTTPDEVLHTWNVYAYIGIKHPRFRRITGRDFWQAAIGELPLHGGCTFLEKQQFGEHELQKVGSDYRHYGDECFERAKSKSDATAVFHDAQELYDFLLAEQNATTRPTTDV